MLPAVDLDEDFVNIKGVAVSAMLSFQSSSVQSAEFDAPKTDSFAADSDAALGEQVFDIPVTEIEAIVEPDSIGNDVRGESVSLIRVRPPILAIWSD